MANRTPEQRAAIRDGVRRRRAAETPEEKKERNRREAAYQRRKREEALFDPVEALKRSARKEMHKAVRKGVLVRPDTCEQCGRSPASSDCGRIEGSHNDYNKPLEVEWLCTACHRVKDKGFLVPQRRSPVPLARRAIYVDMNDYEYALLVVYHPSLR